MLAFVLNYCFYLFKGGEEEVRKKGWADGGGGWRLKAEMEVRTEVASFAWTIVVGGGGGGGGLGKMR